MLTPQQLEALVAKHPDGARVKEALKAVEQMEKGFPRGGEPHRIRSPFASRPAGQKGRRGKLGRRS